MAAQRPGYQWLKVAAAILGVIAVAGFGLEGYIVYSAYDVSRTATHHFPGDRVEALLQQVECSSCKSKDRQSAVWALGQIGDARALPVLRAHVTGRACNHEKELCQYELSKAIRHIEKGIPLHSVLRLKL